MGSSLDRFLEADREPEKPVTSTDDDREWLDRTLNRDAEKRVNAAANFSDVDSGHSTRVLKLQSQTGLDHGIIERITDEVEKRAFGDVTSGFSSTAPRLTKWLSENPHHYAAAKNDIPRLSLIEKQFRDIGKQFSEGLSSVDMRFLAAKDFMGTITPDESKRLDALQDEQEKEQAPDTSGPLFSAMLRGLPGVSPLAAGVGSFAGGIPQAVANQIPIQARTAGAALEGAAAGAAIGGLTATATGQLEALPALVASGARIGAMVGGALEAGKFEAFTAYPGFKRLRDENGDKISETSAKVAATVVGVMNGALEMLELHQVSKFVPGLKQLRGDAVKAALRSPTVRGALVEPVKDAGATGLWEGGTEFAQQAVQTTAGEIAQMASDGSLNRLSTPEILSRIVSHAPEWMQAGVAGAQAGVGFGGFAHLPGLPSQISKARQAQKSADFFTAIGDATKATELVKNLPEKMQEVVERITENGPVATVHAPIDTWNEYWQSQNVDPAQMAEQVTGSPEAYNQAIAMGADLEIPTGRYASTIAPTDHNAYFVRELRLAPDQMNLRESEEFVKTLGETEEVSTDVETAASSLTERLTSELVATGVDESTARTQVETLYGKAFRTLASRGVPLEQLSQLFSRVNVQPGVAEVAAATAPLADQLRRPSGGFRNVSTVTDDALLEELTNLGERELKAQERARYNFVEIEGTDRNIVVPMATRRSGQASRQAKALRVMELMRGVRDRIITELQARGYSDEQIATMQAERLETRAMTALERDEALSESDLSDLPEWARELVDASFNPEEFEQAQNAGIITLKEGEGWVSWRPVAGTRPWALEDHEGNVLGTFQTPEQAVKAMKKRKLAFPAPIKAEEQLSLLQSGEKPEPRGRIRFFQSGKINIELLESANLSTFIHETGHLYTFLLSELSATNESIAKDYQTLREWVGATEEVLTREQQEQIARGFESYIREGVAPSPELHGAFARMKAWLKWVYQAIEQLNVNLTPEVREVFDRLLASDEEIDAARSGLTPLFPDPQSLGMGESEAQTYNEAIQEADAAAREQVEQKLLGELKRETTKLWKEQRAIVREKIAKEVSEDPAWRALSILQRGTLPDGTALPEGVEPFKLSRDGILQVYNNRSIFLRELPFGIYRKEGGLHPDQAAELLGFESGAALLKALPARRGPTVRQHIDQLTDARMKEEHGDLLNDGTLPEEALKAVHSEKRARVLQLELKYLSTNKVGAFKGLVRKVARRIPPSEAVKRQAESVIAQKTGRTLQPGAYLVAEKRAAKNAVDALLRGDVQLAFDEKLKEQFNHELYNAAISAREEIEGIARTLTRFGRKDVRERLGKAGGDYLTQIDGLLDRFDFRVSVTNKALDRREALRQFVAKPENAAIDIPEYLLNEANRKHYSELTIEELRGLHDTVKQLDHFARFKNRLLANKRARELEEAATEASGIIVQNATKTLPDNIETRNPQLSRGRILEGIFASHRKFASLIRQMEGFVEGGPLFEHFVRPIDEAGNQEAVRHEQAHDQLKALFSLYSASEQRQWYTVQAVTGTLNLSKAGRLMAVLNWGNETNRERLLTGHSKRGLNEASMQAILNSLDERDTQFVQGIWDFLETYWPELKQLGQELTGLEPEKVEATPFTVNTTDGKTVTLKGGYFPIKYDDRLDTKAYADNVKDQYDNLIRGAAVRASTKKGMLEERVQGVTRPLLLDIGVIFGHVNDVIHTITHTRAVLDVDRLLRHELVDGAIKRHYGDIVHKEFLAYVRDVAVGQNPPTTSIEHGLMYLRQGAVIAGLGLNLWTSALQPLGISNGIARLGNGDIRSGMKWMYTGISKWLSVSPKKMQAVVEEVHAKSDFMRLRHKTLQREINEIRNSIGLNGGGKLTGWVDQALSTITRDTVSREGIADGYFYFIAKAQMVADIPTWLGAYNKFLSEGMDESKAVALADRAVLESQGGGQVKDLAGVQRGPALLKLFTTFYSYFNVVYNQAAEAKARTQSLHPAELARLAADILFVISIPVITQRLLSNALRGDDDDDSIWTELLKDHAAYLTSTMVGLREISGALQGPFGYSGPAGTRFFSEIYNLAKQTGQGEADAAFWKALNRTGGVLFHYPSAQLERTIRGIGELTSGDSENPLSLIFGPKR